MASIADFNNGGFNNACAGCSKGIKSYATDRSGTLPFVYCNRVCETEAAKKKKSFKRMTYAYSRLTG